MDYATLYRRSIERPEAFWAEQAQAIHWQRPPQTILEYDTPPFRRWISGWNPSGFCHRFDRRFDLAALISRLTIAAAWTSPLRYRLATLDA
ncbi:acetyl-coenzyme A synthetase N-terminal domain-containing protein [Xanthomonas sp. F1]